MENMTLTSTSAPPVRWRTVLGLAATVLAWPLVGVTGWDGAAFAAVVFAATAVTWVAVLGLRAVPRPVRTGTLAGLLYGASLVTVSTLVGGGTGFTPGMVALATVWEMAWAALLGAGAGLLGRALAQWRAGARP
ncbi:hypothetical protein [Cellulomonas shaoxiangyii]|uniref:Uncharacterized protein n=1 Tax=Cellulomonas shaoxiangyii TaxID=2566013 RepID=A0A4P7SEU4_9CELL|nr:hypothetical protein [Cellulomonas shaoxiangyii]QCB92562.1 hypothetical protein E5225_02335 [Cellulomonas shaoxiangyii]TGY77998.1 hypothetical protein E5226_16660 [Cellulomonas shaoxiangyii]